MMLVDGRLALSYSELEKMGLSYDSCKNQVSKSDRLGRSSWKTIKVSGSPIQVLYDTIPQLSRCKLPTEEQLRERIYLDGLAEREDNSPLADRLSQAVDTGYLSLVDTYLAHEAEYYARELAKAHAVLDALSKAAEKQPLVHGFKLGFWTDAAQLVARLRLRYLAIDNPRVLERRVAQFQASPVVCRPRLGNSNAQRLTPEMERELLYLYLNPDGDVKLTPPQILKRLSGQGQNIGISTVKRALNSPLAQVLSAKVRHGHKYYKDFFRPYVKGQRPQFSMSMASADGTRFGLRLRIGGKSTYKRPVWYAVFDVHSECLIGMSMGQEENTQLMHEAFADMLSFCGGLVPMEVQLDNFGKSYESALKEYFPAVSFCAPYNAQSKYAEQLIGRFENNHLRTVPGWLGANIQARKQGSKRNEDYAQDWPYYSFTEMVEIADRLRLEWNNSVPSWCKEGRTRMELFAENMNPEVGQIESRKLAQLYGQSRFAQIRRGYVSFQVDGTIYEYEVPELEQIIESERLQNGFSVQLRYLPGQLDSRVWLFNYDPDDSANRKKDAFLCECPRVQYTQRAKAEQVDADHQALGHQLKRVENFDGWVDKQVAAYKEMGTEAEPMTADEAELVISEGYVGKHLMDDAAEVYQTLEPIKHLPPIQEPIFRKGRNPFEKEGSLRILD